MKPDYTEFDNALIHAIAGGRNTMAQLETSSRLRELAAPMCSKDRWGTLTPTFRIIDRRLQSLRKKGAIRFNGKVWVRLGALGQPV